MRLYLYNPVSGDVLTHKPKYRPKTCFIMTKIGPQITKEIKTIRKSLAKHIKDHGFHELDAEKEIHGRDFLQKIWEMILSVPIGIAIISDDLSVNTRANIFYELGLLQAYGKETIIIKTKNANIPSDFIRTEYIEFENNKYKKFGDDIKKYFRKIEERANYYVDLSKDTRKVRALSQDYLHRAYLITGDEKLLTQK
ncbi:hypothetical protein [Candidiatus Paracoxiella cheracis]|uniref:hypothetical protein n=1 Tax=Candidiatus Paracoxiella cheracis TaxID=3405120 RepID=UPI003BF472FA